MERQRLRYTPEHISKVSSAGPVRLDPEIQNLMDTVAGVSHVEIRDGVEVQIPRNDKGLPKERPRVWRNH